MARGNRICFVSMEVYPILKPGIAELAGGAGFQVVQLARGLQRRGYEVSFIVGDFGQERHEVIDGFDVYRSSRIAYDRSVTRGLANVWRLFDSMRRARADHYILRSIRFLSFFVMLFSRLLGSRYTFMVASLPHCLPDAAADLPKLFRRPYGLSIRCADRVTTQTRHQHDLFRKNFGVVAPVVPNGIEVPAPEEAPWAAPYDIGWVGSFKTVKRADRLIEMVRLLPGRRFLVAGGPGKDEATSRRLMAELASESNVEFLGFVPPDRVGEVYTRARLHLNTSDWEGFPNAFLYAWTRGVPTCSLNIDPDDVVTSRKLGIVDPDPASLALSMDALLQNEETYRAMSRRCQEHVAESHALDRSVEAFLEALP